MYTPVYSYQYNLEIMNFKKEWGSITALKVKEQDIDHAIGKNHL